MSDNVLDYLREQFSRTNAKLDRVAAELLNVKVRLSSLEAEAGHVRVAVAEVNGRLDRVDDRLLRIETRLDLVGEPAASPRPS